MKLRTSFIATLIVARSVRLAVFAAAVVAAAAIPVSSMAADLYWDGDGASPQAGGAGQWNTSSVHFSTTSGGTVDQIWTNANVDNSILDGTAGAVTLAGPITVNTITTTIGGYSIGNGNGIINAANTLTFSGANAGINTTHTSGTTTLTAFLNGITLTKTGAGRLELNNSGNSGTNKYVLKAGALTAPAPSRFGAPGSLVQDFLTFDGGGFGTNTTTAYDMGVNRGITILGGGAFFGSSSASVVLTIGAPIVGTSGGTLNVNGGASVFTGSIHTATPTLVLSNTANSWDGPTRVSGGTLRMGAAGVIPNGSAITLNGGDLDLNNFNETVGTVLVNSTSSGIIPTAGTSTNPVLTATSYDLRSSATISAILAGTGAATKTTSGVVTLTGANTFTGGFNLNAGTVRVGNNAGLGAANTAVAIANSTILATSSATARTLTYAYTVNGNFTLGDATGTGAVTMAGTMNLGSAMRTITIANASDTISGVVSGTGGIDKAGAGILIVSGNNTYDGATTISAGKLQANNANALGSTVGNTQVASGSELLFDGVANNFTTPEAIEIAGGGAGDGGAISVQNSAKITFGGAVSLTTDASLSASNLATATYSNANAITGTSTNLTLQGTAGTPNLLSTIANGTISGAVSLGTGSVTKNESGTWTLSNAAGNSYDGGTVINEGTLLANNTTGSGTGSGAVLVSGTGTLGGTGNTDATGGAVTVTSGAHVKAGAGAASGTLTMPTLNLQSGGLLTATLGTPNNAAKVAVGDTDGATIDGKLEIATVNGVDDGTFRVLTYNGNRGGVGLQQSDQLGNGFDSITIHDSGTSGFIDVTIAITKRQWAVDSDGSWVTGTNWTGGTGGAPIGPGSVANFLSAVTSAHTVSIDDASKTVGIVNFDNANQYTIASTGSSLIIDTWGADGQINVTTGSHEISAPLTLAKNTNISVANGQNLLVSGIVDGSGGIIHSGSGTTTLTGVNTYTGGNIVSAGTLVGDSGSIVGIVADNASLVFNQTTDGTFGNVISGTGTVTKTGSAVLGLTAANTFTGGFNLNAGTVAVNANAALGAANSPATIANGTTISTTTTTARTLTYTFAVNGDFSLGQATGGTAAVTMAGTVNLGGATRTVSLVNAADTISGVISNGGLVVNAGTGVLTITGTNTYSGATTLSTGTTSINGTSTLGDGTGTINMAGGTLRTSANRTVAVANPLNVTANTLVETTSAATTVDLNFSNNTIAGSAGTLTLRNNGADGANDLFQPRFTGNGFNFSRPIVIDNGATGKTKLMSFNTTGTLHTFSGVISGNGSYNRSASTATTGGTSIVTEANTYTGGTTVNDGLLLVNNGSGSGTGSGPVTVGTGVAATSFRGTLGGTGSIAGAITVQEGGTLAPGASIGTLTANNNVTMALNGHMAIELSGTSSDRLDVAGNIDLSAVDFLDVTGTGSGSSWIIATYDGSLTGTFDNITSGYSVDYGTGSNSQITLNAAPGGVLGDFNSDGKVDAGDYVTWRKNDGTNNALANDNGLGTPVGAAHYTLWRANFGNPPGAGSSGGMGSTATVPEPSIIGLLAMGLIARAFRRRR